MSGREDSSPTQGSNGASDASVTPGAQSFPLDERAIKGLREAGRQWPQGSGHREELQNALPVDPALEFTPHERHRSARFIHVKSGRPGDDEDLEATAAAEEGESGLDRFTYRLRRAVVGPPLRSTAVAAERMGKAMALPVLSPDALSSVAYGPEAMMSILVLAGAAELRLSLILGAVIVLLMLSVGLGYRQVIKAYPHGGGSYIVASDSLGSNWGLIAGAGLTVDYIVTVAISVSAGVAAVTSAIPSVAPATVPIGLAMILLLVAGNMRGAREAGALFAAPTYMFIAAIFLVVIAGLVKSAGHSFQPVAPMPHAATEGLGVLLILRAFSSGATAMTGIEVISNAVSVFEPPQAENARRTLSIMIALLVSMFIGVVLVAHFDGASPGGGQTVLSQIAHRSVGGGVLYGYVQVATTLVLLIAANSAFNGFPRLLFFMARDRFAPATFLHMGDRLAFTAGIVVLAVPAALLYTAFGGKTDPLIPLFAVGVFVAFTLAQTAMVVHWLRKRGPGWRQGLAINLLGAVLSALVVVIAAVTKFTAGAWVVVIVIPLLVLLCRRIRRHYQTAADALRPRPVSPGDELQGVCRPPTEHEIKRYIERAHDRRHAGHSAHLAIVPIAALDLAALRSLSYAASLAMPVLAVHVSPSDEEAERFETYWHEWGDHLPLEIISSPYRATLAPITSYIESLHQEHPEVTITVVVPELVVGRAWHRLLHSRIAVRLHRALIHDDGIIVTSVPFQLPA
jgi:amino acid transporter